MLHCIDLFAGAGGLSEGFERQGFKFVAHIEMDYAASLTLKTRQAYFYLKRNKKLDLYKKYIKGQISREEFYLNIPEKVFRKVINREISDDSISEIFNIIDQNRKGKQIDVIVGGPPCQAYSLMGRARDPKKMKEDKRNYLYKQYIRFLVKYKPKIFVFENVVGLLSSKGGKIFNDMKKEFEKAGYKIDYKLLDASDFGVPQKRKRIIIIGWNENVDFIYPEFKKDDKYRSFNIRTLFEDLPAIKSGEDYSDFLYSNNPNTFLKKTKIRKKWDVLTQHVSRYNNERDLNIYKKCVEVWNTEHRKLKYNELPQNLITHKNINSFLDRFNVVPYDGISHTVVAHICKDGHYYIHPDIKQNRSISIREAARIQTFPDDYYFENSRTTAFKQIGNAVPPLMAEKIAKVIKQKIDK
ncbi:DNA cytosine methyltransferase [Clostridium sporogenes]|uniref:Cytosine-specific methyltransferase n=1 Tax=Clostridium sporogenes TaxID=1509 RepID=A0AAE6I851_CLOSG|nr:DNA cytosine methyltransferase [Clostridium sporogenes]QDY32709.1 DNA (cytosine-5-)-methyltransferase [Clostridium sporogenes]